MPSLFTTHTGDVLELSDHESQIPQAVEPSSLDNCVCRVPETLVEITSITLPIRGRKLKTYDGPQDDSIVFDQPLPKTPSERLIRGVSCGSTKPLIEIVEQDQLPTVVASPPSRGHTRSASRGRTIIPNLNFVYNEYGELVEEQTLKRRQITTELSIIQMLRVIKRHYHHDLGKIITQQSDGKGILLVEDGLWNDQLSSWDLRPLAPSSKTAKNSPHDISHTAAICQGQRRVLEIGCSDGAWCYNFKEQLPNWIVEGVDDTDHWMCHKLANTPLDFMTPTVYPDPEDYFNKMHKTQEGPEFIVRNLNHLLNHENPIPHNLYEFIRGREVFDRVESYKIFLEDIRLILKPNGVVEFFEIDPRPRATSVNRQHTSEEKRHQSAAQTDWTDNIQDRFKDPLDMELATTTPGWTARVQERLRAGFRPRDGVPAANLKSWLEGAGFWDVKQLVLAIHVGGEGRAGRLLKEFIQYQITLENEIPKLREELPKVEMSDVESGKYYLNLHVVTGRKPPLPRPGDLLSDGTRQEMPAAKYDAMARFNEAKSSQWKRFDIEGKLTTMMAKLSTLPGVPDTMATPPGCTLPNRLFPHVGRHQDIESPFHAPPFVTLMMDRGKDGADELETSQRKTNVSIAVQHAEEEVAVVT